MSDQYKAAIVVLVAAMAVFLLARPFATRFVAPADFARRRNVWLAMSLAVFVIPDYWAFAFVCAALLTYVRLKDSNPAAVYFFFLLTIPPFQTYIPTFGLISELFPLDHLRMLSLTVLLPTFLRSLRKDGPHRPAPAALAVADWMLIAYAGLQMLLFYRLDSISIWLRQSFLVFIDLVLPYFAIRRSVRSVKDIEDIMASFVVAMVVLALLAVFETLKHWLLFAHVEELWDALGRPVLLLRGDTLRAQVTAGHSIVMGNAFAMALGLMLYLRMRVPGSSWSGVGLLALLAIAALMAGLVATVARGPWLGAVIIFIVFNALGPRAGVRFAKAAVALGVLFTGLMLSPWGDGFVNLLPFIGSDTDGAVGYRQQLAEVSWRIILNNPLFGSVDFRSQMESVRNGEGIIDIVNAYAGIGLNSGFTGLLLFVGFFVAVLGRCLSAVLQSRRTNPELALMGGCLFACVAASLVILTTVNLYISINSLVWALSALAVVYAERVLQEATRRAAAPAAPGLLSRKAAQ
jgi:hypothetical protein